MSSNQIADIYPLSPMQRGMLFDTLYNVGNPIYIERATLRLDGKLDSQTLKQAIQQTVVQHDVLRTLFVWENRDEPLQVVKSEAEIPWKEEDWWTVPQEEVLAELTKYLDNERRNPFELSRAPLCRISLIRHTPTCHYLVFVFHHMILDRWSAGIVLNEFIATYHQLTSNETSISKPIRQPYSEFINWLQAQEPAQMQAFWQKELAGFSAPTKIGIEQPNLSDTLKQQFNQFRQTETHLSVEATTKLVEMAQQNQLTLSTVIHGAWGLLLARHNGEDEVLFGSTVAGRPPSLAGVEKMIGLFINSLPVRLAVPGDLALKDWLADVQRKMFALQEMGHSPLYEVQGWSEMPASHALFDSLVVFENIRSIPFPTINNLQVRGVRVPVRGYMAYPLTLTVHPGEQIRFQITHQLGKYPNEEMDRLLLRLKTVLENMPAGTNTTLGELGILPTDELSLIEQFSQPHLPQSVQEFWHNQVSHQANKRPTHPAIKVEQAKALPTFFLDAGDAVKTLTYAELETQSNQLAHKLRELGVGAENIVAVCSPRTANRLVAILAIMKVGGVYLPLDPKHPVTRLTDLIEDAQPTLCLAHAGMPFLPTTVPMIELDELLSQSQDQPTNLPITNLTLENNAYLMYTSGTTGMPKGVLVSHRALANHVMGVRQQFGLHKNDVVLQFANLTFDVSLEEICPTWASGATLLLPAESVPSYAELEKLIANEGVTVVNLPTPYWHGWVSALKMNRITKLPASLRLVIAGSEKSSISKLREWQEIVGDSVVWQNGYGLTETTISATFFTPQGEINSQYPSVPLGKPMPNITAHVLDDCGQPCQST